MVLRNLPGGNVYFVNYSNCFEMKEYLHLFDEVNTDHIGKLLPCVSDIDNKFLEFRMSEVYCSVTGVFHDNEGFTISHVLDLSKLTTKERAIEALENLDCDESFSTMPSADVVIRDAAKEKFKSEL